MSPKVPPKDNPVYSDWKESREFIRSEIERLGHLIEELRDELRKVREAIEKREDRIKDIIKAMDLRFEAMYQKAEAEREKQNVELARLGVRATFIGASAAAVPIVMIVLWELLRGHIGGG